MENALKETTLQIEKKAEPAGALKAYIYLIMDAQLNIQERVFHFVDYYENADDARTPYGTVCGSSSWGWKDLPGLGYT